MTNANGRMDRIEAALEQLVISQRKTDEQFEKTDEQLKKTDQQVRETSRRVAELTDGWGIFVEGLVAPAIPRIFGRLGIAISQYGTRMEAHVGARSAETDVIALGKRNGRAGVAIAVSVKSRLQIENVNEHLCRLDDFFMFYPDHAQRELIGAVAGVRLDEGVTQYAQNHGLYVVGSSGEAVKLLNKKGFKPRVWRLKRQ